MKFAGVVVTNRATCTSLSHVIGSYLAAPIVGGRSGGHTCLALDVAHVEIVQQQLYPQVSSSVPSSPSFCPDVMSARLWPAKQSILPILPATPLTIRLNLDCHKLNHPTRKHLFRNPSDDDSTAKKPVQEQVLSRRKDHTVPTRWSLYRPLIRNAQKVDRILADTAVSEWVSESTHASERKRKSPRVLTRHIQCQWRRKQDLQGYKRVRIWLSVEYKVGPFQKTALDDH